MSMQISPLWPDFAPRITGIGTVGDMSDAAFTVLRAALDRHGVLVLPDQPMDDAGQIAFSDRWGPMEPTKGVNPASGTFFARQSNLAILQTPAYQRIAALRADPGAVQQSQGAAS